jgi:REP-associated tyrosine transposase
MPEHFHLLIWPAGTADPSKIVQSIKERTARYIVKTLRANKQSHWCAKMLAAVTLPPTVHLHGPHRVWQRRFYDLKVWSEKKRLEKVDYMHGNPVKRGLVTSPDQWPWSSFRFYDLEDASVLPMDCFP